jgi:arginyl-tRNA synthetase
VSESGSGARGPKAGSPIEQLRLSLAEAADSLRGPNGGAPAHALERPPRPEFGDYSSNVAMLLAPGMRAAPREIAERLGRELQERMAATLERVEVAGPGFLNLFLTDAWFCSAVESMRQAGERFGGMLVPVSERERVLVEFVSANPTGPLTVAGGRHAAFGDSLCRVLEFAGHDVEREFYINDHGTQIELFGLSIAAAMKGEEPPEGGYRGGYVAELAKRMQEEGLDPSRHEVIARRGVELMVEQIRTTLERFRVSFDRWSSEQELEAKGRVTAVLELLEGRGHVYSSEGATWLRTTSFGDDKDRVLRRSSDELTYFGSDIAYHEDKLKRGFDRLINVLGADHHGYVGRLKAAVQALGVEPERLELIIMQLVHVVERGERAQMSKRKGEFVTLDDLVADIGVDAARFFMLQRSSDTPLDIDLDLAREQSQENPVYYVQYAHARIAGILRTAGAELLDRAKRADLTGHELSLEPAERALVKRLLELPEEVWEATERRAPHRLTTYGHQVASDFHAFYRDCRVVGAQSRELEDFRLCLCDAARRVIARSLDLLGVHAPERM